jgi:hypothetical protein
MNQERESKRKDVRMSIGVMKDQKLNLRNLHVSPYTGLHEELEHPKIKTKLISSKLVNVMGEYCNR